MKQNPHLPNPSYNPSKYNNHASRMEKRAQQGKAKLERIRYERFEHGKAELRQLWFELQQHMDEYHQILACPGRYKVIYEETLSNKIDVLAKTYAEIKIV